MKIAMNKRIDIIFYIIAIIFAGIFLLIESRYLLFSIAALLIILWIIYILHIQKKGQA